MWIRREGYASNENKVRGRKREGMKIRREVGMERERENDNKSRRKGKTERSERWAQMTKG